nr:MAG TPA: hypothetical protein [Inoviridae sp.]
MRTVGASRADRVLMHSDYRHRWRCIDRITTLQYNGKQWAVCCLTVSNKKSLAWCPINGTVTRLFFYGIYAVIM